MKKNLKTARAHQLIAERPELAEAFRQFRPEAARPPFAIGDAAARLVAVAFELGRRRGVDQACDRLGGVLRSLELEASGNA